MSDIDKLKDLIHPKAIVQLVDGDYGKYKAELREPKEPDSVLWISGIPENTIIFNLDDFSPEPDQIFAGNKQECCRSDYVIISDNNGDRQVVFLEMKSGDDKNSHIKNQLRGANAFVNYCKAILDSFWQYDFKFSSYVCHYVVCKHTSTKKPTRTSSNDPANTDVDNMLKLVGSHTFQFNRLIARRA